MDEIIAILQHSKEQPIQIKMNEAWILKQIKNGFIREQDYQRDKPNIFAGVPVLVTDEVESIEFIYKA